MRKSIDIIGTSVSQFARIIAGKRGIKLSSEITGEPLSAEINFGRWIVRCPYCSGAEIADKEDAVFMCLSCFNEENGGHFRPVSFPADSDSIESLLSGRREAHQNWTPGESLEDLKEETLQYWGD